MFNAETTEQVLKRVQDVAAQLQKHDIFDEIKIYLDTNHDVADTVDVTLHLKEKDKGLFETKVNVGNNQAELVSGGGWLQRVHCVVSTFNPHVQQNGGVGLRNIFGGAESVSANFAFGNRTKASVEVGVY